MSPPEFCTWKMRAFINTVAQRYAYLATIDKLTEAGFELAEETEGENESIHLTLRRVS